MCDLVFFSTNALPPIEEEKSIEKILRYGDDTSCEFQIEQKMI